MNDLKEECHQFLVKRNGKARKMFLMNICTRVLLMARCRDEIVHDDYSISIKLFENVICVCHVFYWRDCYRSFSHILVTLTLQQACYVNVHWCIVHCNISI